MSLSFKILRHIYAIVRKDLTLEVRRGYEYLSSLAFVIAASLVISQIIVKLFREDLFIPSIWIVIVFIGIFTTSNSFIREVDKKTIYGLRLLPIPSSTLFLAKTIYTYILVFTQSLLYLLFQMLFTMMIPKLTIQLVVTLLLFTFNISVIASFTSALVMYSEGRSFLIPMLIFVFSLPIIPFATVLSDPGLPTSPLDLPFFIIETFTVFIAFTFLSEYLLEV